MSKKHKKVVIFLFAQTHEAGQHLTKKLHEWLCKEEGMDGHEAMGGFKDKETFMECLKDSAKASRTFDIVAVVKTGGDSSDWDMIMKIHQMKIPLVVWSESSFLNSPCGRVHVTFVKVRPENNNLALERVFYMTAEEIRKIQQA